MRFWEQLDKGKCKEERRVSQWDSPKGKTANVFWEKGFKILN